MGWCRCSVTRNTKTSVDASNPSLAVIWKAIIDNTSISVDALEDHIESKIGRKAGSRVMITNLRSEFRMILKFLKARGLLSRNIRI